MQANSKQNACNDNDELIHTCNVFLAGVWCCGRCCIERNRTRTCINSEAIVLQPKSTKLGVPEKKMKRKIQNNRNKCATASMRSGGSGASNVIYVFPLVGRLSAAHVMMYWFASASAAHIQYIHLCALRRVASVERAHTHRLTLTDHHTVHTTNEGVFNSRSSV